MPGFSKAILMVPTFECVSFDSYCPGIDVVILRVAFAI
jgi:hypothetical protein